MHASMDDLRSRYLAPLVSPFQFMSPSTPCRITKRRCATPEHHLQGTRGSGYDISQATTPTKFCSLLPT